MKVLVFAATGFIARPIADAFVRAGHIVYGTTRSAKSAKSLEEGEIIPVICDPTKPDDQKVWHPIAEDVDIVIDSVPAFGPEVPVGILRTIEGISKNRPVGAKITYIYCGGSWTQSRGFGGLDKWTSESQPHSGQLELIKWRWSVEEPVLSSKEVHGIVVRPALVYGRGGSLLVDPIFKPAFEAAKKGEVFEAWGSKESRLAMIHVDDLADLFLRVGERGPLLGGQTFIGSNSSSERLVDVLDAVVRVSGASGYKLSAPDTLYGKAFVSTGLYKPTLGQALVGWAPKKMSLADGMDVYWRSFIAGAGL